MPLHRLEMQTFASIIFALAVLHTFCAPQILRLSSKFAEGSTPRALLHLLGEVEVVFGLWAGLLVIWWSARFGPFSAVAYLESLNFSEAVFVFAIMCISATRPIAALADYLIGTIARLLPLPRTQAVYVSALVAGPLLGSLITEPAAMTVTALVVYRNFFSQPVSTRFQFVTLALLFVNISIGGTLTHFAAPPVLMVADAWDWSTAFMFEHFGWKAASACAVNALGAAFFLRTDFKKIKSAAAVSSLSAGDWLLALSHAVFIVPIVFLSHHIVMVIPIFLFFLGWHAATVKYQDDLRIRESLLVAFFLGGLVALGNLQDWWLKPLLAGLGDTALFWGATGLTAITDNAALTYLATLVPDLSESARFAVVEGAVTGGGLTLIANAPNLAGYSILGPSFKQGFSPLYLFLAAIPFTLVAALFFLLAPR